MLSAEERRQKILANGESRLAKLRQVNESEQNGERPPPAPVSVVAPDDLWKKPKQTPVITSTTETEVKPTEILSTFSTISSTISSISSYFSKGQVLVENTREMIQIDQQHGCVAFLGLILSILYSFYISSDSNLFFHVYFLLCVCLFTSRYFHMEMKARSNALISTLMLSGFQPNLVKKLTWAYTLLYDGWIIFAIYFVSFSFSNVFFRLFASK